MAPVGEKIAARAAPLVAAETTADTVALVERGLEAVREPLRAFLKRSASEAERARFFEVGAPGPRTRRARLGRVPTTSPCSSPRSW